ncbi:E3 ubiquitin-protein ligase RNF168-like [Neocloeon triangulifer]|uniref:E3 ubiquitin-protein ligase RNF168-like n=1 Tax=Neocloeon triangulifer TaxID=2078957 RepID=UPI00286F49D3|nr:E3 ubiquitin-protein ligase RNF168-like [Neocloeon triangulifer]
MFKNLSLEKLICPICRGILVEPVTLPCKHALCLECFDGSMEMANLTCPMCRKRVGAWLRKERKEGSLVNAKLWEHIQRNYAEYVAMKQKGEDDCLEDVLEGSAPAPVKICEPGEIRKEFESTQAKLDDEMRAKQEAEEKASAELIKQLREEEDLVKKREDEDERLARELQSQIELEINGSNSRLEPMEVNGEQQKTDDKENKLGAFASSVRGPLDVFFSKVKPLQGNSRSNSPQTDRSFTDERESLKISRCDSITNEFPHYEFAPIHRVPQTPPKLSPDGAVLQVPLIRATPVKHLQFEETPACSPPLVRQFSTLHFFEKRESSTPKNYFKPHSSFSAFKGYQPKAVKRELCPSSSFIHNKVRRVGESTEEEMNLVGDDYSFDRGSNSPDPFALSDDDDSVDGILSKNKRSDSLNYSKYLSTLEQERQDALMAKQLQDELDEEVKAHTSYQLRTRSLDKKVAQRGKGGRSSGNQPTLRETLRRAAANKSTN